MNSLAKCKTIKSKTIKKATKEKHATACRGAKQSSLDAHLILAPGYINSIEEKTPAKKVESWKKRIPKKELY